MTWMEIKFAESRELTTAPCVSHSQSRSLKKNEKNLKKMKEMKKMKNIEYFSFCRIEGTFK